MLMKLANWAFPAIIFILLALSYIVYVFQLCFIGIVINKHCPTFGVCCLGLFNLNFFMVIWCLYQVLTTEEPRIQKKFCLNNNFIQRNKLESLFSAPENSLIDNVSYSDVYNQFKLSSTQNLIFEEHLRENNISIRTRNTFGKFHLLIL